MELKDKMTIIQEFVPGKQITLCHIIANPGEVLYTKLECARRHNLRRIVSVRRQCRMVVTIDDYLHSFIHYITMQYVSHLSF